MSDYMGVDLGGTTIGIGLIDENAQLVAKTVAKTPKQPSQGQLISTLITEITDFLRQNNIALSQVECIGLGVPGQVSDNYDILLTATNLGLKNVELRAMLEPALRTPIYLCNDADAAAYAEAKAGSAKGYRKSITVTIGTGIGTGIVIGSEILPSEGGHIVIAQEGKPCGCGMLGCFEQYASTTALVEQTKLAMAKNPTSLLHSIAAESNGYVSGKTVFLAMEQNDKVALDVFDRYIKYLGAGLVSLANVFMPDIICLSGGISVQGEKLTTPLNNYLAEKQYPLANGLHSKVVQCTLGSDAGIIGAALFALDRQKKLT